MESVNLIDHDVDTLCNLALQACEELESSEDGMDHVFSLAENIRTVVSRILRLKSEQDGSTGHEETKQINREMERKND